LRYLIEHSTAVTFPESAWAHQCELRLAPPENSAQRVHSLEITVDPEADLHRYVDAFGNDVRFFSLLRPHDHLTVHVRAEVETLLSNPFDFGLLPPGRERQWIADALRAQPRLWAYVLHRAPTTPRRAQLAEMAAGLDLPEYHADAPLQDSLIEVMEWIGTRFEYDPDVTHVHASLDDVLGQQAGVCQDFAHLMITVVRSWGFPARYAMGYVDPGFFEGGMPLATHAWTEVLLPGAGWRGFDPTHGVLANDAFVVVAVGRDSQDAAPVRGSFKGDHGGEHPEVHLSVVPQH
jgi:transglutaminase-like putative cysteine protease